MSKAAVIEATMKLAAERPWRDISLSDIASEANISLAGLRQEFPSKGAIIGAFARQVDDKMLQTTSAPDATRAARDRLFEVIMNRFDVLAPYKQALKSMSSGIGFEPGLLTPVLNSQRWILEAAGIPVEGPRGNVRVLGLAALYSSVFRTWLDDNDPALAKTMAELDSGLRRGESLLQPVDRGLSTLEQCFGLCSPRKSAEATPSPVPPAAEPPSAQTAPAL